MNSTQTRPDPGTVIVDAVTLTVKIHDYFHGDLDKIKRWLLTRNKEIGGLTPLMCIFYGGPQKFGMFKWVERAVKDNTLEGSKIEVVS